MNNNLFKDLKYKVFQSGNPVYFYIGINVIIFVAFALINIPFFLSGNGGGIYSGWIREYAGFPADLAKLPVRFYAILTYQFFHDGLLHILFNMLWLFWMGRIFLDFLKPRQFHFVYLAGGFAGALLYLLAYNIFPVFATALPQATIIGSSASVMAVIVAAATLVPDYSIRLLFLGDVKLKYLALAYIVLDLIGMATTDAGGSFAHLGGAVLGFTYIKLLRKGTDWSSLFKRKPKLKVVRNEFAKQGAKKADAVNQEEIDRILDKISKSGYDKLNKEEKETLFKASKH
ncbi:rhomboid family intramembrane serine protease [Pedobacter heparinus]|uniref:Rhomboid family protein n=1 Tax=Pedobacter heparinus (strain ATCC 13125 / DSM 2366 / CIP 104194 / JCM 7457 / NBRC 12017 / NCIMB 9290 / NRRL B-14731 / HIM 762-3) TaxID=485917 RepID=C6Y012_PEDHD|nr:rhomboid family intramembrane serine protease [Pedobacter heparinus]ACU02707.1 Rhomboid family protein [Pedobacter heparinus DSM 2366]